MDENLQNIDKQLENLDLGFLDHLLDDAEDDKPLTDEEKKILSDSNLQTENNSEEKK